MGADIHGVLQRRFKPLGSKWPSWVTEEEIYDARHYLMFSYLADVRNYGSVAPISEPRGLPEDFKIEDDEDYGIEHPFWKAQDGEVWMGDHSFSWLSLEEIRDFEFGSDAERLETFLRWVDYAASRCGGHENGRIVFGFDS